MLALMFLPMAPARADGLTGVFRTREQQAAKALADGDAKRAQSLATSNSLRGAAAYRAGDYAASEAALAHGADSDSQYNLGNALAKQQRYEDALAAYDRALKANPANADAAANRKAVADFLQKQKQQDQDNKNDKKDGKGQQDKKQGQSGDQGKDQQGQQGQQGDDASKGESGQQPGADGKGEQNGQQGSQDKTGEGEGGDKGKEPGKSQAPQGDAETKSAAERQQAAQAQAALKQQMDAALAGKQGKPADDKGHDLGQLSSEDASSKLPPDVRRALMRVPDDPGGLLRRKFMLEYQRRHGAEPEE